MKKPILDYLKLSKSTAPTKLITFCSCNNGTIDCPGCKGASEQDKIHFVCARCKGIGRVTCGKCGGHSINLNK
jgi:hypothetical protein